MGMVKVHDCAQGCLCIDIAKLIDVVFLGFGLISVDPIL